MVTAKEFFHRCQLLAHLVGTSREGVNCEACCCEALQEQHSTLHSMHAEAISSDASCLF